MALLWVLTATATMLQGDLETPTAKGAIKGSVAPHVLSANRVPRDVHVAAPHTYSSISYARSVV